MSISGYGVVEYQTGHPLWLMAARMNFFGEVNTFSLLAHPWGRWEPDDDLPKPVVDPRGLPQDLSGMTRDQMGGRKRFRCATWLTMAEVEQAAQAWSEMHPAGRRFYEIEAVLGVMKPYEEYGFTTRLVMWFR